MHIDTRNTKPMQMPIRHVGTKTIGSVDGGSVGGPQTWGPGRTAAPLEMTMDGFPTVAHRSVKSSRPGSRGHIAAGPCCRARMPLLDAGPPSDRCLWACREVPVSVPAYCGPTAADPWRSPRGHFGPEDTFRRRPTRSTLGVG